MGWYFLSCRTDFKNVLHKEIIYEPLHDETNEMTRALNKDSD